MPRIRIITVLATFQIAAGILFSPVGAQNPNQEIIGLNNEGVKCLNTEKFDDAIEKFRQAIKLEPNYRLPQENLIIAHNRYGLKLMKSDPKKALVQFHQSAYLNPNNPDVEMSMNEAIKVTGKNPENFYVRQELAKLARSSNDLSGAFVEYKAALKLMDEAHVDVIKSVKEVEKLIMDQP